MTRASAVRRRRVANAFALILGGDRGKVVEQLHAAAFVSPPAGAAFLLLLLLPLFFYFFT